MPAPRLVAVAALSVLTAFGGLATAGGAAAAGGTLYVAPDGHDGQSCADQSHPCKTVNFAVAQAGSGDTVSLAAGTYAESVFVNDKSLTLRGPASGTATITGSGGATGVAADGPPDGSTSLTLSHLQVFGVRGAPGVTAVGVRTTVSHSVISDNDAAGVEVADAPLTISDSTVSGSRLVPQGAGELPIALDVATIAGSLTMTRTTVSDSAQVGVFVIGPPAGGPAGSPSTITDSTISGNGFGGVASGLGADLTIESSTVADNGGLGVYGSQGAIAVHNSTVSGTKAATNAPPGEADVTAGLYYISDPTSAAVLPNRTTKVRVARGKQLVLPASKAPHARVAAAAQGITVSGSVLDQTGKASDCTAGGITDAGYNLSADADNSCGFSEGAHDVVKTDPKLGALADNGGATRTQLPHKGSAAIDAIPSGAAGCTSGADDQRGVARPQGTRCDMGAVEREQSPLLIAPKTLPHGQVGQAYREQLHASGGLGAPYAFSLATGSSLPKGLKLSGSGEISGTPTKAGTVAFTVSVDDPVTRRYTLVIDAAPSSSGSAQPNGSGSRLADTGAPTSRLTATGGLAVLAGLVLLVGAGAVGRRRGRHRAG